MIYESYPWKEDLLKQVRVIEHYNTESHYRWNYEKTYFTLEKAIFTSAFIIRKLIECWKVSDEVENYRFNNLLQYKALRRFDHMHRSINDKSHDWEHPLKVSVMANQICNSLIHSLFFDVVSNESNVVEAFLVASDYDKNKFILEIPLDLWLNFMKFVSEDDVISYRMWYDKDGKLNKEKQRGHWIN